MSRPDFCWVFCRVHRSFGSCNMKAFVGTWDEAKIELAKSKAIHRGDMREKDYAEQYDWYLDDCDIEYAETNDD